MDYRTEQFIKGNFTEDQLEQAVIELFTQQGYTYVHGDNIHRRYEDILLLDDLREYLQNNYYDANLSEMELQKIISRLTSISAQPLYEGNRDTFRLVNEGFDLEREDKTLRNVHIDYIDYDHPENNIFKIVNQYTVKDSATRRPDFLVFINGIPVTIFEFKTAIQEDTTIYDAWKQVTIRYARDIPALLKYCFLSVICDGANTRLGSVFTAYPFYYAWNKANEEDKVSNGISALFTMVEGVFAKERLTAILRDFIFYPDNSEKSEVFVCRYPQYFAANKMLANIKAHMKPQGDGKGGTYFGATGCGKTLTMLYLSRLMVKRDNAAFNNPTIIIIVDREDLDKQAATLFERAKNFLCDSEVCSIKTRKRMAELLKDKPSGGVYVMTIQKFCKSTGLLSDRNNIICISDEAHRTQTGIGAKNKRTKRGVITTYGFAKYLRDSFPNATYCGFTGTPVDESLAVFGGVVDSYTMKESCDDGITVRIAYEPRLARVMLSDEQVQEIKRYYNQCAEMGATQEAIEESEKAMSRMSAILGHPERLKKLAADIVQHYEKLCAEKPGVVQKAMIVCVDRPTALKVLKEIIAIRPDWGKKRKAEDESTLTPEQRDKLLPLPKINLVATPDKDDEQELFDACGTDEYRKNLDDQFKIDQSNFKIAVVVNMWITGFDVPSLAVMYIDKPLQKHTLIQTISRVNRVFEGKDKGLIVDYIGIKQDMMEALKKYNGPMESPVEELNVSLDIFRNHLSLLDGLMSEFNAAKYYYGEPLERLTCLNNAVEFVQIRGRDFERRFMDLTRKLKSAFNICCPSGELTDGETAKAQFYMAVRSLIYKQTEGNAPDIEIMNTVVEDMVRRAISCTGVENIVDDSKTVDIFSEEFLKELEAVKMPVTKFNALLKLLRSKISSYSKVNKVKAIEFDKRLRAVVERYNSRDNLVFVSEVTEDFINNLSDEILRIMRDLEKDKTDFIRLGVTFEEKAFYDILVSVRDTHGFPYADDKCVMLAKKIKALVDDKSQYADWATRMDIKNELSSDLTVLLYDNGYPPEWDNEVFEKVLSQAENFKKYNS